MLSTFWFTLEDLVFYPWGLRRVGGSIHRPHCEGFRRLGIVEEQRAML
jgi:hypothetical protein